MEIIDKIKNLPVMSLYNEYNDKNILKICKIVTLRDELIRWTLIKGCAGDRFTLYRIMLDYPEYFSEELAHKYFHSGILTDNGKETKFLLPLLWRDDVTLEQKKEINNSVAKGKNLRDNVRAAQYFRSKGFQLFCGKSKDFLSIRRECVDKHIQVIKESKNEFYEQELNNALDFASQEL